MSSGASLRDLNELFNFKSFFPPSSQKHYEFIKEKKKKVRNYKPLPSKLMLERKILSYPEA